MGLTFIWIPVAVLVAATSVVAIQGQVLPRWLGWAGLVTAVVQLLAAVGVFADKPNFWGFLGFIAFILFALWVLATGIILYLRTPAGTQPVT